MPGTAYYAATKFGESRASQSLLPGWNLVAERLRLPALEGFSETLASELDPAWNIRVGDTVFFVPLNGPRLTRSSIGHRHRAGAVRYERVHGARPVGTRAPRLQQAGAPSGSL